MNYLWAGMMMVSIIYGAFCGAIPEVTQAALDSSKEAVTLCITMLGVLSFWMGLMQIGMASGLIAKLTSKIRPMLHWLFPKIPIDHPAMEQIAMNCIANMLGLGWAATPAGLRAMEELKKLKEESKIFAEDVASDEMCTFLVLNISSLQLIPVNMIAYRSQYGSVEPTRIIGPVMVATFISTLTGIIFCKIMTRRMVEIGKKRQYNKGTKNRQV